MSIREIIVAKRYKADGEPETYVVKDWQFREGQHVWLQIGRDLLKEAYKRYPHAKNPSERLAECDVWHKEAAEGFVGGLRDYCEIRGPAPK